MLNYQTESVLRMHPDPVTRAPLLLGLSFSLHFVALMFVSARIRVKRKLGKLEMEDVLIVISSVLTLGLLATTSAVTRVGFGMHTYDFQPEWKAPYRKFTYATTAVGSIPFAITKLSMLCFYLRLAPHRKFRIICHLCITYIILVYGAISIINTFGCTPLSGGWSLDPTLHARCITSIRFNYFTAFNNTSMDILLLVLPIPIVLQLRLGWRVKLCLVGMFTMGFLVTAVSGYFLYTMYRAINSLDNTWDAGYCWMIAMIECNVGIMTACMPGVMMFVRWMRGDAISPAVLGVEKGDLGTIGGGQRRHRPMDPNVSHTGGSDEEYGMRGMGTAVPSTEVLVESEPVQCI